MITKITDAWLVTYSDTGQIIAGVQWQDHKERTGTTQGELGPHMQALFERAGREGVQIRKETW